ncbi:MAG: hypothetical protein KME30_32530 [Iphinoe sp. HA4291-MV1]|nr:hypothetical protein [Iphinoe sp. HA4291-MV1]
MTQVKLQTLKDAAFALAKKLGLSCTTTKHFKKRFIGLDFRTKSGWAMLIERLKELAFGVLVPFFKQQPIAA